MAAGDQIFLEGHAVLRWLFLRNRQKKGIHRIRLIDLHFKYLERSTITQTQKNKAKVKHI